MTVAISPTPAHSDPASSLAPRPLSPSELTLPNHAPLSPYAGIIDSVFGGAGDATSRIVLFVSVEPQAGVTRTASAVAGELAAGGRKVLLADAGIVTALPERKAVSLCERMGADRIWVLGTMQASRTHLDPAGLNQRPFAALHTLSREFPYIVLDAPALASGDAALRLAQSVETILVVRRGRTETRAAVRACHKINAAGGSVLGCVYNEF